MGSIFFNPQFITSAAFERMHVTMNIVHCAKESAAISLASAQWDARPAHFFVSAALAAVERQRLALAARAAPTRGDAVQPAQPVAPGTYVGQVIMRSSLGIPQPISDEQYASWLEARPA